MAMETMIKSHEDGVKILRRLTKDIKFCMLTTVDETDVLRCRPMTIQQMEVNGDIWMLIGRNTGVAAAVARNDYVNASFANNCGDVAVSVYGRAKLLVDRKKVEELWEPIHQIRFPYGPDDPNLLLLKIEVESAEHWDSLRRVLWTLFKRIKLPHAATLAISVEHANLNYDRDRVS